MTTERELWECPVCHETNGWGDDYCSGVGETRHAAVPRPTSIPSPRDSEPIVSDERDGLEGLREIGRHVELMGRWIRNLPYPSDLAAARRMIAESPALQAEIARLNGTSLSVPEQASQEGERCICGHSYADHVVANGRCKHCRCDYPEPPEEVMPSAPEHLSHAGLPVAREGEPSVSGSPSHPLREVEDIEERLNAYIATLPLDPDAASDSTHRAYLDLVDAIRAPRQPAGEVEPDIDKLIAECAKASGSWHALSAHNDRHSPAMLSAAYERYQAALDAIRDALRSEHRARLAAEQEKQASKEDAVRQRQLKHEMFTAAREAEDRADVFEAEACGEKKKRLAAESRASRAERERDELRRMLEDARIVYQQALAAREAQIAEAAGLNPFDEDMETVGRQWELGCDPEPRYFRSLIDAIRAMRNLKCPDCEASPPPSALPEDRATFEDGILPHQRINARHGKDR